MSQLPMPRSVFEKSPKFVLTLYFAFKILPTLVAAFSIYLGYRLFILGVTGQASLSVNTQTVSGQLLNAAPGLFFAVGGIVTLIIVVWKSVDLRSGNDEMNITQ